MLRRKASLTIIFITVFIDLMGFGILIPILPTFASKNLAISDFGIGTIIAIYSLMQFLFNPILGKISDRIGRKPVIVISLLFTVASYVLFAFSNSFLLLFASRLLAGLGGSNIGVAQAYIADVTDKSERAKGMGLIGAAFGLGFVFGPMIGGYLSYYGYMVAGLGAAAFSFMAFLFALIILPESHLVRDNLTKLKIKVFDSHFAKEIFKHPSVGLLILLFFLIVFSFANIYGTFALLGYKVYGFTDQQNGYLFGVIGIVGVLIQGGGIRFASKKFSERSLILSGALFMMVGLGFMPYGVNFTGMVIVATIFAIGTGLLQPTILSMISKYSPDEDQGAILGFNQSMASFARVLGPLWGGFAFEVIGYEFPFLTGALIIAITFLIVYFLLTSKLLKANEI